MTDPVAFVRTNAQLAEPPLVPEIRLHLATEVTPLWQATETTLARANLPPPYWAFAWPGGQAVARHLMDSPQLVAGRAVFDFAAGSGIAAIAAVRAGAARVVASDIDDFALAAIALNAGANGVAIEARRDDPIGDPLADIDVIIAGDVCYERPMADRVIPWLKALARRRLVVIGDPGRAYLPKHGLERLAEYDVPTTLDLEDRTMRHTVVWRVLPDADG